MPRYLALTIGPIYKTFTNVRKTREVWAASYMFSYLLRLVIEELLNHGIDPQSFVVPFVDASMLKENNGKKSFDESKLAKGTGLFPDRLILLSNEGDYKKLESALKNAATSFSTIMKPGGKEFLDEYLRFCYLEKELPAGTDLITEMFNHLDTLELQSKPLFSFAESQILADFFHDINRNKFFKQHALNNDVNGNNRFQSVVEIATKGLQGATKFSKKTYKNLVNEFLWEDNTGDKDNDQQFIEALKESLPETFKPYHKYMAVIKADGDKIGSAIKSMNGDVNKLRAFSKSLYEWANITDKKVRDYGGVPIYIGGDDVLLFAPVAKDNETIVDLVKNIDDAFKETAGKHKFINETDNKEMFATLSYGISINYYKFPLFEAMGKVDELLHEAKNFSSERNAICIRVLKHSGSELKTTLSKKEKGSFGHLKEILKHMDDDKSFLNSVMYNLRDNEAVLHIIGDDKVRFENFLRNSFDEYKQDNNPKSGYLKSVKEFLPYEFEAAKLNSPALENETNQERDKRLNSITTSALNNVYSTLRIARFIKGLEDDK